MKMEKKVGRFDLMWNGVRREKEGWESRVCEIVWMNLSFFLSFSAPTPMREKSGASFIHSCKSGPPFFLGLALQSHYLLSAPPFIFLRIFTTILQNWSWYFKISQFLSTHKTFGRKLWYNIF
jgi:hypothetical protein